MAVTKVASATTAGGVLLLAAGSHSKVIIENSDANRLHVQLADATTSTADFSFSLAQNEKVEIAGYPGVIKGIWAADGSGSAHVTTIF